MMYLNQCTQSSTRYEKMAEETMRQFYLRVRAIYRDCTTYELNDPTLRHILKDWWELKHRGFRVHHNYARVSKKGMILNHRVLFTRHLEELTGIAPFPSPIVQERIDENGNVSQVYKFRQGDIEYIFYQDPDNEYYWMMHKYYDENDSGRETVNPLRQILTTIHERISRLESAF